MFNLFGKSASLDDLIARKKYAQALVVMREQFRRKSPDAPARQRFAELLILADRRAEAVPILLGLADEHLRFGFVDKAKDALARIEQLESGRSDVARRLQRIAGLQKGSTESPLGEPGLAAEDDSPETGAGAAATVAHETEEPAGSESLESDLSPPIALVLEDTADGSDGSDPIHVELMDLFPMGEAGNPAPPAEREAPIRRRGNARL